MKKTIIIMAIALISHSAYAQWSTSGSTIYYNSGNVGIGTASPSSNLQVGTSVGTVTSTPVTLSLGGTFSSTHGVNPKLKVYDDGTSFWGLGISSSQLDYIVSGSTYDHTFYAGGTELMRIKGNGNVGMGETNPSYKLTVNSQNNTGTAAALLHGQYYGVSISSESSTSSYYALNVLGGTTSYGGSGASLFYVRADGNIGIGTTNPGTYKLAVNGGIHSQSVNVDLTGWSDYVFKQGYILPSLTEVKTYIDQNHHLPDMPSEQEVIKEGVNLGEMNKLLTKKVEELTLYLIEKDKTEKQQQEKIATQEERISKLEQSLEQLLKNK